MPKRKSISKKVRFEVLKRDKFTCQYCGRRAPDIVLNIDHIRPITNGGDNSILNLVTSCFDCNNGKRDNLLNDNSVIEKQRAQLELLQERREQLEMMLEWQDSLKDFEGQRAEIIMQRIEKIISPHVLKEQRKSEISKYCSKYTDSQILENLSILTNKFIRYDEKGATRESAILFLDNLPKFLVVSNQPPIQQRISYINGICRNRFSYWNPQTASMIINDYISALKSKGWSDEKIINDLEHEVIPMSKNQNCWTTWRACIEGWTTDILNWES